MNNYTNYPRFPFPKDFENANAYLQHLTYQGAEKRYGNTLDEAVKKRIEDELKTIQHANRSDYFLFIWDIISDARDFEIMVGPGRGSAAGSIVNYCLGITGIDPIKHGLLFERFFRNDQGFIPDIDIDFDADGCGQMFQHVTKKYGNDRVARIGIPSNNGQLGMHACGIIISPDDISKYTPVKTMYDASLGSDVLVTEYDAKTLADMGMMRLDFLGLDALRIISNTLKCIKGNHKIDLDINAIPLDDPKTLEFFANAETEGIFQFESEDMQKWLKELKPDRFEDLVAMNALYRPGLIDYIPQFIKRKHGKEPISYNSKKAEEILAETYGLIIYQEQVMLLKKNLADFKYAFNKSHALCYTYMAYQMAYLKAHYPDEFIFGKLMI